MVRRSPAPPNHTKGGSLVKQLFQCLMQVQNVVTLILTIAFLHLAISGKVAADQFLTIFSVVIAFYYGSQSQKNASGS